MVGECRVEHCTGTTCPKAQAPIGARAGAGSRSVCISQALALLGIVTKIFRAKPTSKAGASQAN